MSNSNPTTLSDEQPVKSTIALQLRTSVKGRLARVIIGIGLSTTALYLSLRGLHFSDILAGFALADLRLISIALVAVIINIISKTIRWRAILGNPGRKVSFLTLLRTLLLGQILNIVLPSRVGDVSRVYMIGSAGVGWPFVAGTIVTEKAIDLICYMLCFLLTLTLLPSLPGWVTTSVYSFFAITTIITAMFIALSHGYGLLDSRYLGWIPQALRNRVANIMQSINLSFMVVRRPWVAAQIIFWSFLVWTTAVLTNYLILCALRIDAPAISALLLLIVLQISISLPSVPGKIGLFQYACVLTLGLFGVSQTMAVNYGILLHIVAFLPIFFVGGMLFVIAR